MRVWTGQTRLWEDPQLRAIRQRRAAAQRPPLQGRYVRDRGPKGFGYFVVVGEKPKRQGWFSKFMDRVPWFGYLASPSPRQPYYSDPAYHGGRAYPGSGYYGYGYSGWHA